MVSSLISSFLKLFRLFMKSMLANWGFPDSSQESFRKGSFKSFLNCLSSMAIGTSFAPKNTHTKSRMYFMISCGFLICFISTISWFFRLSTAFCARISAGIACARSFSASSFAFSISSFFF